VFYQRRSHNEFQGPLIDDQVKAPGLGLLKSPTYSQIASTYTDLMEWLADTAK